MMKRRRPKGAPKRRKPSVLSSPVAGQLATDSSTALPPKRRKRKSKSDAGGTKVARPSGHPLAGDVLNAFWQKSDLILVVPDASTSNGIKYKRLKAEHSCFVKVEDVGDVGKFLRMLNHHGAVRSAIREGDWIRICWRNRDAVKHYCKLFHSAKKENGDPKDPIQTYEGLVSPVLRYMVDNDKRPAKPRQLWIDIETDSRVPIMQAVEGHARILCWSAVDADGNEWEGMLEEFTDADEERLLRELWDVTEHFDQVMAWNGDRFDFPVIKARSERYNLLRPSVRDWRRWLWLDHLDIFKRMNMSAAESGDEKTSFALNPIAMSILGVGKDDFDSSRTYEAWAAGGDERLRLGRYCMKDTKLMPAIEAKTGFIMLLQTVADTCGTFPDTRGSNPGVQVEGFLARLAKEHGRKFPTVFKTYGTNEKYEGAYVLHPEKNAGVHRGIHVADFASLYPTIICTWNMSPETILKKEGEDYDGTTAHSPLTQEDFRTDFVGILPLAVSQLMDLRKSWNDKKASLPPGTDAWKEADRRSAAYKITANSFYGVIGAPTSRHYDRRVAESVTQCGKWLILEVLREAEARGMRVIYGDTDSIFVADASQDQFEGFVGWCNETLFPDSLDRLGCKDNRIKLAYEKQFDRLIFTAAKRYVGNYVHYKGSAADETSKPEIKGLEFKRGDSIRLSRRFQEQVAHMLVGYKCEPDHDPDDPNLFEAAVSTWLDYVLTHALDLDDISVSKRLNKPLGDYKTDNPMVRIARMMEERGEDVGEGAKIPYVVVDASQSPQAVIPAQEYDPEATDIERMAMWDSQVWPPTQRLLEAAFPEHDWSRFTKLVKASKAAKRAEERIAKATAKAAEKARKAEERERVRQAKADAKAAEKAARAAQRAEAKADKLRPPKKRRRTPG